MIDLSQVTWEQVILAGKIAGAVASMGAGVVAAARYIVYPIWVKCSNNFKLVMKVARDAATIHDIIKTELSHNGGSSLKDAVRRIEQNLAFDSSKLRAYMSLQKQPYWESDEDGNCLWVNDSYIRLTGYSLEHLKNMGWMNVVKKEERRYIEEEWLKSVLEKRTFNHTLTVVTSNGDEKRVQAQSYPIGNGSGDVAGYIGIFDFIPLSTKRG